MLMRENCWARYQGHRENSSSVNDNVDNIISVKQSRKERVVNTSLGFNSNIIRIYGLKDYKLTTNDPSVCSYKIRRMHLWLKNMSAAGATREREI